VGWAIDKHMRSELVERALKRALWCRKPPKGLMVHTDQGSQFISNNYRILLGLETQAKHESSRKLLG